MSGGRPDAFVVLQAAAGGGTRVDEFKYYGDTGYKYMGRYNLHSMFGHRCCCPGELAEVYGLVAAD